MNTDNAPQIEVSQPHIVSVRSLVEFVLQAGDLTSGGFQRRDRAQLGTQGHKRVQRSRSEGYETEVEIAYQVEGSDPPMEVRGRIDGLYAGKMPVIIEEIKTTTLNLDLVSEGHNQLHWAQAQCYAYMYARQHHLVDQLEVLGVARPELDAGERPLPVDRDIDLDHAVAKRYVAQGRGPGQALDPEERLDAAAGDRPARPAERDVLRRCRPWTD